VSDNKFPNLHQRNDWIAIQRFICKRTYKSIGSDLGLSVQRCSEICKRRQRKFKHRAMQRARKERRKRAYKEQRQKYLAAVLSAIESAEVER
jgi:hypothetical protein